MATARGPGRRHRAPAPVGGLDHRRPAGPGLRAPEPAARHLWRLFTSVDFAVVQIIALALLAVFGMTIRQLPDFAFRSRRRLRGRAGRLHARLRPVLGAGPGRPARAAVAVHVFPRPWFSAALLVLIVSIVICTLDRTPRLWRGVGDDPGRPARAVLRPAPARSASMSGALPRRPTAGCG